MLLPAYITSIYTVLCTSIAFLINDVFKSYSRKKLWIPERIFKYMCYISFCEGLKNMFLTYKVYMISHPKIGLGSR